MSLESGLTFFIAIFVFSISPGPGVFVVLASSLSRGVRRTLPLSAGMACGDILYLVMACFGLATIAEQWASLFLLIRYFGAAYLIYFGWKLWQSRPEQPSDLNVETQKLNRSAALQGFLISSSNPKVILFYIAFLPTFMDVTVLEAGDIVIASGLAFTALMAGLTLISAGASRARRYMKSEQSMKMLNRGAGSMIMGAGSYLALRG
ncbi:LysE family translocator [Marinomonas piezotolerans]|uniref:LysE family translocator n=1 Tax=Marinomonas piezotolerans TaxID=2213058 RepID=A0A370U7D3_9GAMM|nr:LysE family translocator [Marinomonas piezotolerans]RDL43700.1 LysE family translocator [Marinomonas piezotolerans]